MIDTGLQTTSYGHILARQLRAIADDIPECRRQEIADELRGTHEFNWFTNYSVDPNAKAYMLDLLEGRTPKVKLGQNRKLREDQR